MAFAEAGIAHQRTRVILGRALDVLARMTDAAYDLAFVDGDKDEYPAYVREATRLLRPGGVLALDNMFWHDQVADPTARDERTRTLRDLGKALREDDPFLVGTEASRVGGTSGHAVAACNCVSQCSGLVGGHFDDQPSATLQRHAQNDPAAFFGDLEWTISGPRLHRRHGFPFLGNSCATA